MLLPLTTMTLPHFSPFRGARPSCPWCSSLFLDGEPTCGCIEAEEAEEPGCPCCEDGRTGYWGDVRDAWDRDYGYRDYDDDFWEEIRFQEARAAAWSEQFYPRFRLHEEDCACGICADDGDDCSAWRRAFPLLAWEAVVVPCIPLLPSCPEPWERWEDVADGLRLAS